MEFIYDNLMSEIQYVGIVLFYFAIFICNNLAKLKKIFASIYNGKIEHISVFLFSSVSQRLYKNDWYQNDGVLYFCFKIPFWNMCVNDIYLNSATL